MPDSIDPIAPQFNRPDKTKLPEPDFTKDPISPDRYYSTEFMKLEWEKVWTKTWQIAGLVRQLNKAGDYISTELGAETILCVKGEDQKIRAFYNVCQHRGMMMVQEEQGHARRLVCPYHGWAYSLDGVLRTVPDVADFPEGSPCGQLNLVEIPCETWAGFVWFNMDPGCKPLRDFLGAVADQIDCYPMEDMVRTHWVTLECDFNWKLIQDNFNESYHVPFVHPRLKYILEYSYTNSQFDLYPSGHCRMLMPGGAPSRTLSGGEDRVIEEMRQELTFWELDPESFRGRMHDMRAALQGQKRLLGAKKGFDFSRYDDDQLTDHWHYTIFPNLSFSLKPDGNIWLRGRPHPRDPEKCLFDMWYLTLFPKEQTTYYSNTMKEFVSIETPAPHVQGKVGELSVGSDVDEDLSIWTPQQRALHSRGYRRDRLAWQERRVRFFHENLAKWMAL